MKFYYHEKISQAQKADEYEGKIKSPYYRNLCLSQLSDRSIYNRDFAKAHAQLAGALAYFANRRFWREEIEIQSQMAKLWREKGNFQEAESLYKTIYIKSETEGLALRSAAIAVDLGNLYMEEDDDFQAECWYQKALHLFEKEKNADGIMLVNSNLINIFFAKGNWLEAEKLLRAVLAANEEKQLPNSCAIDYLNWANLENLRLHDDKALKLLEHATEIFKNAGNSKGLTECAFLKGQNSLFRPRAPGRQARGRKMVQCRSKDRLRHIQAIRLLARQRPGGRHAQDARRHHIRKNQVRYAAPAADAATGKRNGWTASGKSPGNFPGRRKIIITTNFGICILT